MSDRIIKLVVIHASATKPSQDIGVREIDRMHRARGFLKIGYHYVIRRDGMMEKGRSVTEPGAHVEGHNKHSIGICMVGGIDGQGKPASNFTDEQWRTLSALVRMMKNRYPAARICGHRDLSPDKNRDGRITPNEYLKDCPCFDVASWLEAEGIE